MKTEKKEFSSTKLCKSKLIASDLNKFACKIVWKQKIFYKLAQKKKIF